MFAGHIQSLPAHPPPCAGGRFSLSTTTLWKILDFPQLHRKPQQCLKICVNAKVPRNLFNC
ncbi:MAG TPA: hypothetical protein PKM44_02975, partial [Turneriella sp.]|nr:hypothetical protein [Turneriella sp.]